MQAKRVCKAFKVKNVGEYHVLYVRSDTLLLAEVFENFWSRCFEISGFDVALVFLLH